MDNKYISSLKKVTPKELYEISLESSNCKEKEIFIFEKGSMSDLFDREKAEILRKNFLKNNIKVNQITNIPNLPKFTDNEEFVNQLMNFRYIPKEIFSIENEILIFDNTVVIYNCGELLIIKDEIFAKNQKQLFMNLWDQGQSPKLDFEYKPNHSFYKSLDFFMNNLQIIVWPDADSKESYKGMNKKELENYIINIIKSDSYYDDSTYIIAFIWSMDGDKMIDIWKFNENHVDDRSGPLGDVRVYREGEICDNLGLASGNTLLVLGYEEKLRRQSKDLKSYLNGPMPKLPLEIVNGKSFFQESNKFKNKIILITGASRGIGKSTALLFAKEGAKVVVNYFSSEKEAFSIVNKIKKIGSEAIAIKCDVSKENEVKEMIQKTIDKFGKIDILINNAGIVFDVPFFERTVEQWQQTSNVNLLGTFLCSKYASEQMLKNGNGKIINISSTNGINTLSPESVDYDTSKAGVINLTKNLAKELAPKIQVNSIAPGWVDTQMNKDLPQDYINEEIKKIYLKRFAKPEEIAESILFLASDDASYITGSILKVDGGYD